MAILLRWGADLSDLFSGFLSYVTKHTTYQLTSQGDSSHRPLTHKILHP
jgi:hypothetical protein